MYKLVIHKKITMIRLIICLFVVISMASCSARKNEIDQKNLIPEKDLIPILTDIHIANGLLSIPKINSRYSSLDSISTYYQIIEKHGFTKEAMNNTMKYYFIEDPKKLSEIYDQVLVILSKRESGIEKDALIEQNRQSNLWKGKDFIAKPSVTEDDSTSFLFNFIKAGYYALSFTATVYPDDESFYPRSIIYSTSSDSSKHEKREYLKPVYYLKDGLPHYYVIMLTDPKKTDRQVKGWFFESENSQNKVQDHFLIENISITYSPALL